LYQYLLKLTKIFGLRIRFSDYSSVKWSGKPVGVVTANRMAGKLVGVVTANRMAGKLVGVVTANRMA
jgi:hypothetical protein